MKPACKDGLLPRAKLLQRTFAAFVGLVLYTCYQHRSQLKSVADPQERQGQRGVLDKEPIKRAVWWHGQVVMGTGYGTESLDYIMGVHNTGVVRPGSLWVTQHCGPSEGDPQVLQAMNATRRQQLESMMALGSGLNAQMDRSAIVVCHSVPACWGTGSPYSNNCPPYGSEGAAYVVGRAMWETTRLRPDLVSRANLMDEVWVPCQHNLEVFKESGVTKPVIIMPGVVDTDNFDPAKYDSLPLPLGTRVLGPEWNADAPSSEQPFVFLAVLDWIERKGWDMLLRAYLEEFGAGSSGSKTSTSGRSGSSGSSSSGKNSPSKQSGSSPANEGSPANETSSVSPANESIPASEGGSPANEGSPASETGSGSSNSSSPASSPANESGSSDSSSPTNEGSSRRILGRQAAPPAALFLLTKSFDGGLHGIEAVLQDIRSLAASLFNSSADEVSALEGIPPVYVIYEHVPDEMLPRLYKAAGAFVLPSRGEGWGRPHVESMAMGVPVIATNWSCITAFLDESVGYPIAVEGLVHASNASQWYSEGGQRWAQPSVPHLRQLMRHVVTHPEDTAAKGAAARRRMQQRYAPSVVARLAAERLQAIDAIIHDEDSRAGTEEIDEEAFEEVLEEARR